MAKLPHNMKPVVCIAGPTASGKSAWAIELAKAVDGEIINADSMQVYKELHIITARPGPEETTDIPHHLFGHVSASEQYTTARWLSEATDMILDCLSRSKTPVLVGGTGLYFKALTEGLAAIPQPDASVVREIEKISTTELRLIAEDIDPIATARVLGDDRRRLERIVTVARGTSKTLSAWQASTKPEIPSEFWLGAVILPEREELYGRINKRFDQMIKNGGLDEVKRLKKMGLNMNLTATKAIGVPPFIEFLDGKISYEEALSRAKRDTRRYAKRQFTWFRGQARDWFCVKNSNGKEAFRQKISHFYI